MPLGRMLCVTTVLLGGMAVPAAADHPRDVRNALSGLCANNLAAADKVFQKSAARDGADRLLALYELGSIYHLAGDPGKSIGFFNSADAVARAYEGRAVISAGATGRSAGAVLVNDSLLTYEGMGYDKVMSRTLNAVNFMLLGDMEGARVELRKAEEYQRLERERHQREVQRAGTRPPAGAENASMDNPAVSSAYARMNDFVKNVRNSFENAFTYYLASQIYLARGQAGLNDALVEIKRAYQLAPNSEGVRSAYLEIARAQSAEAYAEARRLLRMTGPEGAPGPGDEGTVVVLFESGLVPPMGEVKISLYANEKLYGLAFPIYSEFGAPQAPLSIGTADWSVHTAPVLDTRLLAVKALQERMPGILVRGLLGAVAKGQVQQKAEKNLGVFGGLISMVASSVLTSADRRSWLSLPAEVQVARFQLGPGPNQLDLRAPGLSERVTVNVTPGSQSFLVVRAFPGFRRVDVKTFQPGEGDAAALPGTALPAANLQ